MPPVTPGEILPAREQLGDLFLALNNPEEALIAYEKDLKDHSNRLNGIYGAAIASQKLGNMKEAKLYFEKLIKLVEGVDREREEIKEARGVVREI